MKVLLDLVPLKQGGGLQVGLNFIDQIDKSAGAGHRWTALVTRDSAIARAVERSKHCEVAAEVPSTPTGRLWFERSSYPSVVLKEQPDVVFSVFGTGPPPVHVPTVVGSAYSNLYYLDIDFWGNWPFMSRWLFRLRDIGRLHRTKQADALILETAELARRAARMFQWDSNRIFVVRPSPSAFVSSSHQDPTIERLCEGLPPGFRVLLLTGWHENKGLRLLPAVARAGKEAGFARPQFVVTIDAEHPGARQILADARSLGVADQLSFIGPVPSASIATLYRAMDAVLLLSVLESFSNNIAEAWMTNRPLVITDADWSRDICGDGAVYVDRANPSTVAAAFDQLAARPDYRDLIVRAGRDRLARHPDAEGRFKAYIHVLETVQRLGKRPRRRSGTPR